MPAAMACCFFQAPLSKDAIIVGAIGHSIVVDSLLILVHMEVQLLPSQPGQGEVHGRERATNIAPIGGLWLKLCCTKPSNQSSKLHLSLGRHTDCLPQGYDVSGDRGNCRSPRDIIQQEQVRTSAFSPTQRGCNAQVISLQISQLSIAIAPHLRAIFDCW